MIDIFEAKKLAEEEVKSKFDGTCCVHAYCFVAVSRKKGMCIICPTENDSLNTGCEWIFRVKYYEGSATAELFRADWY